MQFDLSSENAQFLQSQVAAGTFATPQAALDAAIALLKRQAEIYAHVRRGCEQLDRGEYTEFDDEGLAAYFGQLFGLTADVRSVE